MINNLNELQKKLEEKAKRRAARKKHMKVSGKGVFELKKIIAEKTKKRNH